jgi:hypothetical protein
MLRIIALWLLLCGATSAQERPTLDKLISFEIGQCVIQRSSLVVENEALKAQIEDLRKQLAPKPEQK